MGAGSEGVDPEGIDPPEGVDPEGVGSETATLRMRFKTYFRASSKNASSILRLFLILT